MEQYAPYMPYIVMAVTGIIAGWLAGLLLGGGGLIRNLIVGLIGAFIGGLLVSTGLLRLPFGVDGRCGAGGHTGTDHRAVERRR